VRSLLCPFLCMGIITIVCQPFDTLPNFSVPFRPDHLTHTSKPKNSFSVLGCKRFRSDVFTSCSFPNLKFLTPRNVDPANKVRVAISVICGKAKRMKYNSQQYCDKTMDDKMALYRECCFPSCRRTWWIKLYSQVVWGGKSSQSPPGSAPAQEVG